MGGACAAASSPRARVVAHSRRWEAFQQEAFVRLGPRRFDELKRTMSQLDEGAIKVEDAVARARYFMMPDHEDMHERFQDILRI